MHKTIAMFMGVLATVSILASGVHSDPRAGDNRGLAGGRESFYRGGPPQGFAERGSPSPSFRSAPPPAYGGYAPRGRPGGDERYSPNGGYPGGFRYAPPPPYPDAYAPARRPNSLGAGWRPQQEEARIGVKGGQMASLGSVIQRIGHRSGGRSLDAGIEYQGGRAVYRVRWLMNDGRRVDYLVDAATGRILGEH